MANVGFRKEGGKAWPDVSFIFNLFTANVLLDREGGRKGGGGKSRVRKRSCLRPKRKKRVLSSE